MHRLALGKEGREEIGREQESKQIIHTQCMSIFWSLSLCPVVVKHTQIAYI